MSWLSLASLAAAFPLVVTWRRGPGKPLVAALAFGLFITWLGQQGSLSYLGVVEPSRESWRGALVAIGTAAWLCMLLPEAARRAESTSNRLADFNPRTAYLFAWAGIGLMGYRFATLGIPLISGSRFATVASLPPLVSLATSMCLAVSVRLLCSSTRKMAAPAVALLSAELGLVVLSGSRLLLMGLIVIGVASRFAAGVWRLDTKLLVRTLAVTGLLILVVFPTIYSMRATSADGTSRLAYEVRNDPSLSQDLIQLIGPGTYIGARNGAAVSTRLLAIDYGPAYGYVGNGLLHVFAVVPLVGHFEDPEIFLTETVFGLDSSVIGSTALPVATAVQVDLGLGACAIYGLLLVMSFRRLSRYEVVVAVWFAFGVAMSSYGMYLVSLQFLSILIALIAVRRWLPRVEGAL